MEHTARELSVTLESVSKALAEWSVGRHFERDPSLPERYGPAWRRQWVAEVQSRVRYLAQAVALQCPEILAETAAWSRAAFAARELGLDDVRGSLQCLGEVIGTELPDPARASAVDCINAAVDRLAVLGHEPAAPVASDQPHRELMLRYMEAMLDGRPGEGQAMVLAAVEGGLPVADVYLHVLQPALTEIGRMWHQNEITVADEHLATSATEILMAMLRPHFPRPHRRQYRIVATTIAGELHALGVRMVADFFEMDGWETFFLGANTPAEDLIHAVKVYEADLLAASVMSFLHLRALGDLVAQIRADRNLDHVRVLVGGTPFRVIPDLWRRIGADGSAASAADAVRLGNELMTSPTA